MGEMYAMTDESSIDGYCGAWDAVVARRRIPDWPKELMPPLVMFVAGYRRTGKTTFGEDLSNGTFTHEWDVYAPEEKRDSVAYHRQAFLSFQGTKRFAFADELRRTVAWGLGLPINYDFEAKKDTDLVAGKLVRQHLIDLGAAGRAVDPAYWAKVAMAPLYDTTITPAICTDWRFVSEHLLAVKDGNVHPVTVRLYRSDVPVPARSIESEHDLDAVATDYLLVPPHVGEFHAAARMWPQYRGYQRVAHLSAAGLTLLV